MTSARPPVYNGRYELQSQVARGGTAEVYLARDIILGRSVALKVLFPELSTDHTFVERFRREAQAAASLSHPNIVPVFDWGESENTYFIVMEYVDGEPLSSIIHTEAPLAPGNAAQIAVDIAKALAYADRHGVVHRDVKPGNVLITSDGQVKVTDFGIARAIGGVDEQVTQTGLVMGTATYFSPEQAQGLDVDGRSDIYSLGVVLYEMCTGRPPFSGETPVSIAYQHVQETPPRPRSLNPDLPPALEAIILQAMAKLPAERYQTADELRADLERLLRNQTVLATPPSEFGQGNQTELITQARAAYGVDTTAVPATAFVPPRARTTTPYWIAAAVVLIAAIVAVAIFGGRSLGYFGGSKYVKVPYLIGDKAATAESTLRAKGFNYTTSTQSIKNPSNTGKVLNQSPRFPTSTKSGTSVKLFIGGKVAQTKVPSVVNLQSDVASSRITSAGLKVSQQTLPFTLGSTAGKVTAQEPSGGTKVDTGTIVQITVIGKPTVVKVPTLSANEGENQAAAALGAAGFNPGGVKQIFSQTVPAGDVITSDPAPGTAEPQGKSVELVVSKGPGIQVPNVVGMTLSEAQTALSTVGLTTAQGPTTNESNPNLVGIVISQSPSEGKLLDAGNAVTLSLGALAPGATTTTTTSPIISTTTTQPFGNTGTPTGPPNA